MAGRLKVENEEISDLTKWLSLGFGKDLQPRIVGHHISKSYALPIVAADIKASPVEVTWFAQNFYFYFLGVSLKQQIPATFLYPISGIFTDVPLSGHVNKKIAPDLPNFEKSYHNCENITRFGSNVGNGFGAALAIRYLLEVAKLDREAILDVCLRKTEYGKREKIDGNTIDFERLARLIGLEPTKSYTYDFDVKMVPDEIFEKIQVDWFDIGLGKSSVHVKFSGKAYLPTLVPFPADIYVDLHDTLLGEYVPERSQAIGVNNPYSDHILFKVPARLLPYRHENGISYQRKSESVEYPVSGVYQRVNEHTRQFTFNVPNVLDCALTAFFFIKIVAPLMQELSATRTKS